MKILIIDDDRFLTKSMERSLTKGGYDITVINKASDIVGNMKKIKDYDLILLDLMMRKPADLDVRPEEETGEALFRSIRKLKKSMPVIIITGKDKDDIKTKFSKINVQVLIKPFSSRFEDLYEAIRNV